MRGESIIIWLLLANALVAIAYCICMMVKGHRGKGLIVAISILCAPIVAPLFLAMSALFFQILFKRSKKAISTEELSFNKQHKKVITSADIQRSTNIVPIEEALIVSDKVSKRNSLLDVLKYDDYSDHLKIIREAVEDDDTEIAHYSASTITKSLDTFKEGERELREGIGSEQDVSGVVAYVEYLRDFLVRRILVDHEQREYVNRYESELTRMTQHCPGVLSMPLYKDIVMLLLEQNEQEKAKWWLEYLLAHNQEELSVYKTALLYYYKNNMKAKFFDMIETIKNADITLDSETLELIRFYG